MTIVLVVVIVFCFTLLGYKIALYYINRKKFFSSLEMLLSAIELDVVFSQDKLKNVIQRNSNVLVSKDLILVCSKICEDLENKKGIGGEIFNNITILKKDEKEVLLKFFSSLGRFDALSQSKEIKAYSMRFNEFYIQADNECKKYASLFIKLGLIFGLMVCLLII